MEILKENMQNRQIILVYKYVETYVSLPWSIRLMTDGS